MIRINACKELSRELLTVSKPARYTGGELGSIIHKNDQALKMAISFPDMYEIGMSNQAIRILYNRFNRIKGIQCERVFAPARDFEDILRNKNIPLFTLETGIPLKDLDILAFSMGYELTLTNLLNILDLGNIPLRRHERSSGDPIIIVGGPAATNPEALADFVDFVYIGEGEGFIDIHGMELANAADRGAGKAGLEDILKKDPASWWPGKSEKTIRAIHQDFGTYMDTASNLPLASLGTVQDHGVLEIMRGCPNGCRFCHAGYFYRPYRQKNLDLIIQEVEHLVNHCGFRTITLSSLSSGDYQGLFPLVQYLNNLYGPRHISFQLPSLRVNSLNLEILSQLSTVRKSGLTFAVECPDSRGQKAMNKDVSRTRILSLLKEAREHGWKMAKFYFMLGLPVKRGDKEESQEIVNYLQELQRESRLKFNVNAAVFIPKAHTPYEREGQLTDSEGMNEIKILKEGLKGGNFKFSFHSPYSSFIEGIICRGDSRAGEIVASAFHKGARFDAWDEFHDRNLWKQAIGEADWDVEKEICRKKDPGEILPWVKISLRTTSSYLNNELKLSEEYRTSESCKENCKTPCGVCSDIVSVRDPDEFEYPQWDQNRMINEDDNLYRNAIKAVFAFSKTESAVYLGHLDTLNIMERAFQCSGLEIFYTKGFNPKPRIEFAHPLSLGIKGSEEILGVEIPRIPSIEREQILNTLNENLPGGFLFHKLKYYPLQNELHGKKKTLMSLYAGSRYSLYPMESDKAFNLSILNTLNIKAQELSVMEDYHFTVENEEPCMKVKAIFKNKKMNNILRFLKEALSVEPLMEWKICRDSLMAKDEQGKMGDYFSLDSSQN